MSVRPRQPEGAASRSAGCTRRAAGAGSTLVRDTVDARDRPMRFTLRRRRVRGARGRDARGRARPKRRSRRLPQHLPRPAARRLHGRRGGAERARPGRRAEPMLRATLVELEDGLERRGRSPARDGSSRRPSLRRYDTVHAALRRARGRRRAHRASLLPPPASGRTILVALRPDLRARLRRRPAGAHRDDRRRSLRRATTSSRSSAGGACGTSARSGSCSRPARSSGR